MAKSVALVGIQNGDEGKGKIDAYLYNCFLKLLKEGENILTYRWQGANNAGHTVKIGEEVYKLHQIPSATVYGKPFNMIGKGGFVNTRALMEEMTGLINRGIDLTPEIFGISSKVHVILDHHVAEDQGSYNLDEHSSTGRGIKEVARDKAHRKGIRFIEFLDSNLMIEILKEKVFPKGFPKITNKEGIELKTYEEFVESYDKERKFLAPFVALEHEVFNNPIYKFWLGEGAQGMAIDMDDGQYPGTTSSCPGQPTHRPDTIIGVLKAYTSSVGIADRPFVTEMSSFLQDMLRDPWGEFGTSTGKPRHLGWIDFVAMKYHADSAHVDYIVATCLDKLEILPQHVDKIPVAVAYKVDGKRYNTWDISFDRRDTLRRAQPIYEQLDPWDQTVEKDGKTLTPNAEKYVDCIEQTLGKKIILAGIGPEQNEIVERADITNMILQ